jgi:hypothetical protein
MKKKKCTGLKGIELTSIMFCGYLKEALIYGNINGNLFVFSGTTLLKSKKHVKMD